MGFSQFDKVLQDYTEFYLVFICFYECDWVGLCFNLF